MQIHDACVHAVDMYAYEDDKSSNQGRYKIMNLAIVPQI